MTNEFSVLMSVYVKESPEHFETCMKSLQDQTVKAGEVVIVKDGEITAELQAVIDKYKDALNIKEVALEKNGGLGVALSVGIKECSYELVARMDTDDIAVPDRFKRQLKAFEDNDVDICGGQITEFETDLDDVVGERRVPLTHDEIYKYQKTRCAFNHMTVMYKKSVVLAAGNYKDMPYMEDDMLWVDMLLFGARAMNLDVCLCYVRASRDMIARRGGLKYYRCYKTEKKQVLKSGFITRGRYLGTTFCQFIVCLMPGWLRKRVYFGLLHKRRNKN